MDDLNYCLYNAAAFGRFSEVADLLKRGDCDVNYQNMFRDGKTPLYIAASWGSKDHLKVIEILLNHGASIDLPNVFRQTPIYVAASWGNPDVVLLLARSNANVNVPNDEGRTPLHIAACPKPHLGVNHNIYHDDSTQVLFEAAKYYMHNYLVKYSSYLPNLHGDSQTLLSVNLPQGVRVPPNIMDLVIYYNHFSVCTILVEAGANINALDKLGQTPLDKASIWGHTAMVMYLTAHNAIKASDMFLQKYD